jgi:hypothetical protein
MDKQEDIGNDLKQKQQAEYRLLFNLIQYFFYSTSLQTVSLLSHYLPLSPRCP